MSRLMEIGNDCPAADCGPFLESLRANVDTLAGQVQRQLQSAAAPDGRPRAADTVATLNHFVFDELGIRVSEDLNDHLNLTLSGVLNRKQGYCVGIASLYLALAEQLRLPIHAVATPSHILLRYDDGSARINIETLQRGANLSDEEYIHNERIPQESLRRGIFMRGLNQAEFLSHVLNNLAIIHSRDKEYDVAAIGYREALRLNPHFPAALYNYATDLMSQRQEAQAARLLSRSLRLYPSDPWALNNRGLAYARLGKISKARSDFQTALSIEPSFEQARKNLANLLSSSLQESR